MLEWLKKTCASILPIKGLREGSFGEEGFVKVFISLFRKIVLESFFWSCNKKIILINCFLSLSCTFSAFSCFYSQLGRLSVISGWEPSLEKRVPFHDCVELLLIFRFSFALWYSCLIFKFNFRFIGLDGLCCA